MLVRIYQVFFISAAQRHVGRPARVSFSLAAYSLNTKFLCPRETHYHPVIKHVLLRAVGGKQFNVLLKPQCVYPLFFTNRYLDICECRFLGMLDTDDCVLCESALSIIS